MIIVKLQGGLGNQMFQYAAARRLAAATGSAIKLDLSWFEKIPEETTPRGYELHVFDTVQDVASRTEIKRIRGIDTGRWPKVSKWLLRKAGLLQSRSWIKERSYSFDPQILRLGGDCYLDGFWQSPKYFDDVADLIRKEFTVTVEPDPQNREIADLISRSVSVSVHLRRGDYVSNATAAAYHGVTPVVYYQKAMAQIASRVERTHFFIFSDDPEWARQNLTGPEPMTFVNHNGPGKGYEDLRLMKLCRHHVLANSSFSWWGAWLATDPEKIVVAPKKWFGQEIDTSDLIPQSWLRL